MTQTFDADRDKRQLPETPPKSHDKYHRQRPQTKTTDNNRDTNLPVRQCLPTVTPTGAIDCGLGPGSRTTATDHERRPPPKVMTSTTDKDHRQRPQTKTTDNDRDTNLSERQCPPTVTPTAALDCGLGPGSRTSATDHDGSHTPRTPDTYHCSKYTIVV